MKETEVSEVRYTQLCCEKDATDDEILKICNKENPASWGSVIRQHDSENQGPQVCPNDSNRIHIRIAR